MCRGMTRSNTVSGQGRGFPQRRSGSLPAEPGKRTSESNRRYRKGSESHIRRHNGVKPRRKKLLRRWRDDIDEWLKLGWNEMKVKDHVEWKIVCNTSHVLQKQKHV